MTTKSFIKTIGSKGLLADYNTEGKKLQTELTAGDLITIANNVISAANVLEPKDISNDPNKDFDHLPEDNVLYYKSSNVKFKNQPKSGAYRFIQWTSSFFYSVQIAIDGYGNLFFRSSYKNNPSDSFKTWRPWIQLQENLTFDTTPKAGSKNPVTSDGIKTAVGAKVDRNKSVAIFDGYMRRMNESTGWRRLAYKQVDLTNKNINALFRLYLFGSTNDHIGLGDLIVNIRFNASGSAPELKSCYLMNNKPLNTSVKVKVIGVAGNAVVELWCRPLTYSMLTITCLGNGQDVTTSPKDWTFGRYLDATDPEPVEDIANNIYVFSGTTKRVQLDIDNPTSGNLVAMNEKGLVKDSGISITSSDITNWNSKQPKLTFDTTPTAGSNNPVTSDGIKTALDSRVPAPTSTTGTQVLKCIDGVIQWVTE